MPTTIVPSLTSRVRLGLARADVTPPAGIFHPCWGAARHTRATGVHRPLCADVMALGPANATMPDHLQIHIDLPGLTNELYNRLTSRLSAIAGVPAERVLLSCSHTHAVGWLGRERFDAPGGELIPAYIEDLLSKLEEAVAEASKSLEETLITYAYGSCNMAVNRDYWDEKFGGYVCGFNPDAPADDTLLIGRITDLAGRLRGLLINYACHATTLAWENTLISPDFAGALRDTVETQLGIPCIFAQGACGDLGPRYGFVGDTQVADQNGRWVAYSALATLESMGPPAHDYIYQGPVISGATLGVWTHQPFDSRRWDEASHYEARLFSVELPIKALPKPEELSADIQRFLAQQKDADARGETILARDLGARAERARRWLARLDNVPAGATYAMPCSAIRLGDAIWVTTGSEPYNYIQSELRSRFRDVALAFSPLTGGASMAYLLTKDHYGLGLYQEEPSILAAGCLEILTEGLSDQIGQMLEG